jgi:hypothetical protein
MKRVLWLALAAACCAAGCGDSAESAGRSDRLVDFSKRPPFVNSLGRDARTGEFMLTTNRGFFRIDPDAAVLRGLRRHRRAPCVAEDGPPARAAPNARDGERLRSPPGGGHHVCLRPL